MVMAPSFKCRGLAVTVLTSVTRQEKEGLFIEMSTVLLYLIGERRSFQTRGHDRSTAF